MTPNPARRKVGTLLVLAAGLALCHRSAHAAGIALQEQDAQEAGDAYAGDASAAQGLGTIFYNPAGMTQLNGTQVSIAGQMINYGANFHNTGSSNAPEPLGNNGGNAGTTEYFPNIYAQTAIGDRWRAGVALNVPYGFVTDYQSGWMGRYDAQTSQVVDINLDPSVAYKVTDAWSLGAGFDVGNVSAKLNSAVDDGALCYEFTHNPACFSSPDGFLQVTGQAWGYGWNAGTTYDITPQLRAGFSYRSEMHYTLEGSEETEGTAPYLPSYATAHLGLVLPQSAQGGLTEHLTDQWTVMGNVTWTGWHVLNSLNIGSPGYSFTENLDWKDTYTFAAGTTYRLDSHWLARGGFGYDQTPVRSGEMTAAIPDTGRWRVSVGGQYKIDSHSAIDLAYSHLFTNKADIDQTSPYDTTLIGYYTSDANLVSLQYTLAF